MEYPTTTASRPRLPSARALAAATEGTDPGAPRAPFEAEDTGSRVGRESLTQVDHFRLGARIGAGGMATVYRATDLRLGRDVALKVLHEHIAAREDNRKRFAREARAIARIEHPNILRVFSFSSPEATVQYLATELIEGPTLRQFVERRGYGLAEAAALTCCFVARALAHAHQQQIIHRDVKPENVMIAADGTLRLMDFGLAHVLDGDSLTATGAILGSPAHMSPELIEGEAVDHRADIFAFGTLLYFAISGTLPFDGRNPAVILNAILTGTYQPIDRARAGVPSELASIVADCLQRDPAHRPVSMAVVAARLQAYLNQVGIDDPEREQRAFWRNPDAWEEHWRPKLVEGLLIRAQAAHAERRPALVVRLCERALALAPDDPRPRALVQLAQHQSSSRTRGRVAIVVCAALAFGAMLLLAIRGPADPIALAGLAVPTIEDRGTFAPTVSAAAAIEHAQDVLHAAWQRADVPATAARDTGRALADHLTAQAPAHALRVAQIRAARIRPERNRTRVPVQAGATSTAGTEPVPVIEVAPAPVAVSFRVFPHTARVRINDQVYDQAADLPASIALAPGRHRFVANVEGLPGARLEQFFTVQPDRAQTFSFRVPWPPARLRVESRSPGTVFLGDQRLGATNELLEIPIVGADRRVTLVITAVPTGQASRPWRREIELDAGSERAVEASF